MSLIIKGMEMPKTCCQCDLKIYNPELRWDENGIEQIGAWVCKRTREIIWNTQRGENCPLLPLPEGHGRCIDADKLIKAMFTASDGTIMRDTNIDGWSFEMRYKDIKRYIKNAPTIVPAEGGTDNG